MSSNELSFDEKKSVVQDNLISVITETVSSPIVRFWKPEERTISERDMGYLFKIYNGFVYITHYSKRSRQTEYTVKVGRDFKDTLFLDLALEPNVLNGLKAWLRSASKALENHFVTRYEGIYIGRLRFDFLTQDYQTFVIPNFMLETNIFLYKNLVSANNSHYNDEPEFDINRITVEEFVNDEWSDILAERDFRSQQT